jgi:hypothetical protein
MYNILSTLSHRDKILVAVGFNPRKRKTDDNKIPRSGIPNGMQYTTFHNDSPLYHHEKVLNYDFHKIIRIYMMMHCTAPSNHHVSQPNHHESLLNHHVSLLNHHVSQPNHHVSLLNHHVSQPNHHVSPLYHNISPLYHNV